MTWDCLMMKARSYYDGASSCWGVLSLAGFGRFCGKCSSSAVAADSTGDVTNFQLLLDAAACVSSAIALVDLRRFLAVKRSGTVFCHKLIIL